MKVVEMLFEVTETLQNGNERTRKVKVYSKMLFRHKEAEEALKARGYYSVVCVSSKWKEIIVV